MTSVRVIHFQHADHVGNVSGEVDGWMDQVRAVSLSGERHRKRTMAGGFEMGNDPVPAPTAMPRAMNENKGRLRFNHLPLRHGIVEVYPLWGGPRIVSAVADSSGSYRRRRATQQQKDPTLSHSSAKEASSGQSNERIGNGHASNRIGVAPSRTAKEASSRSFLSKSSSS
jgi:hypothetical protein